MQNRISIAYQPVKDDAALHGSDIGHLGIGTKVVIDDALEHDGWAPIIGPEPLGPVWLKSGKQGWVKLSRLALEAVEQHQYLLTLDAAGAFVSCKQIS